MSRKLHWICHHSKVIYVNGCREPLFVTSTLIFIVLCKNLLSFYCTSCITIMFSYLFCFACSFTSDITPSVKEIFSACADMPYVHAPKLFCAKSFPLSGRWERAFLPKQARADRYWGKCYLCMHGPDPWTPVKPVTHR